MYLCNLNKNNNDLNYVWNLCWSNKKYSDYRWTWFLWNYNIWLDWRVKNSTFGVLWDKKHRLKFTNAANGYPHKNFKC